MEWDRPKQHPLHPVNPVYSLAANVAPAQKVGRVRRAGVRVPCLNIERNSAEGYTVGARPDLSTREALVPC